MLGSFFGVPLSSTHCNIGALFGLSLAENFGWFKEVYELQVDHRRNKMHLQVVFKVGACWLLTVPSAIGLSVIIDLFIKLAYH
mmetsp:Transcript_16290/g.11744  ORF Transcript_16290/g.11744 Transcript_16290/m.11744 type:complete len:83 (-) Transcript_16290:25-273(-)